MIREKEIEEYIPKGKKTTITIEDYNAGYAAIFDVYGFKIVGKSKNHLCLLDDNMKTVFMIEAKYPVFPGFFSQSVGIMQN